MRGHEYGVLVAYLGPSHVSRVARWNLKQPSHAGQQTFDAHKSIHRWKYRLILILIPSARLMIPNLFAVDVAP